MHIIRYGDLVSIDISISGIDTQDINSLKIRYDLSDREYEAILKETETYKKRVRKMQSDLERSYRDILNYVDINLDIDLKLDIVTSVDLITNITVESTDVSVYNEILEYKYVIYLFRNESVIFGYITVKINMYGLRNYIHSKKNTDELVDALYDTRKLLGIASKVLEGIRFETAGYLRAIHSHTRYILKGHIEKIEKSFRKRMGLSGE